MQNNAIADGGNRGVSSQQCYEYFNDGIFTENRELPLEIRLSVAVNHLGVDTSEYAYVLERGKTWLIEPLRTLQPKSFAVLNELGGPLVLGVNSFPSPFKPLEERWVGRNLCFDVNGRMIEVRPRSIRQTYEDGNDCSGSLLSLPDALAKSWLWRTGGWRIPGELPESIMLNRQLIGHPSGQWQPIDHLLVSFHAQWKKRYMPVILERFPEAVVTHYNPHDGSPSKWTSLRCFLDTRPSGVGGPVGDQLLVFDHKRDQVVYHIHQGDVEDIRILHDPADAIDQYCAHVLARMPGEFDFSPWSQSAHATKNR